MQAEPTIAFATTDEEPPGLQIRINFGVFAGRDATPAELDELGWALLPEVGEVSVVAEQRHEMGEEVEVVLHQVRVEIAGDLLPEGEHALGELQGRVLAIAERWAETCIAERHSELSEL